MSESDDPIGTWYLTLKTRISNDSAGTSKRLVVTISAGDGAGTFTGGCDSDSNILIDNVSWDQSNRLLTFRKHPSAGNKKNIGEWFRGTIVEGVFTGRFTEENKQVPIDLPPADLTKFVNHSTGWNKDVIDQGGITPRVFDISVSGERAIMRIDSAQDWEAELPLFSGTVKPYSPEKLEFDMQGIAWDGSNLVFRIIDATGTFDFKGTVSGVDILGTYVYTKSNEKAGKPKKWSGRRCQVLSFGLSPKPSEVRDEWQGKTRARLQQLMMAANPNPVGAFIATAPTISAFPENSVPCQRDDGWQKGKQGYVLSEVHIMNLIPDPFGGVPIVRRAHGWLSVPNPPPPPGTKCPAVLALNGHRGSAHRVMDPNGGVDSAAPYWYGDAFARRFFHANGNNDLPYIVLAIDISHRDDAAYNENYLGGDDSYHGNGPHPSVRSDGFKSSDWEETGERAWDVMRALDLLLSRADVDASRILITGLSMGGEVSMVTAALDPRIKMAVVAGAPSDYNVQYENTDDKSHLCWQWINADVREYVDASDFWALTAPRPLIVETGRDDSTYSNIDPRFAGDKQAARRARAAYGSDCLNFIHYLHTRGHQYNVGAQDRCSDSKSETGVQVPVMIQPAFPGDWTWQIDKKTDPSPQLPTITAAAPTIFDYIDEFLKNP